jgi:hypothetical protein
MSGTATKAAPRKPVGLAVIFGVLGLGLAGAAWYQVSDARALATRGVRTEAQVASVDRYTRRGTESYVPTFTFRTAEGRVVRERSSETYSSNEEFAGGRRVAIVYDPTDTSRVRLASSVDGGVGILAWLLGGLAALSLAVAGYAMVATPKTRG